MVRILACLAALLACANAVEPIPVACGSSVVHDLVRRIGGERVAAQILAPYGCDPHTFQPTPAEARTLAAARLVVVNGLGFEGWFEGLLVESRSRATVVEAARGVAVLTMDPCGHGHDHGAGVPDPHAFNAPAQVVRYAENIRDGLAALDPEGRADYEARAAAVVASLRELDAWTKRQVAAIPRQRRILVTNHEALNYFCRDYGFTVKAPLTALDNAETSPQELAAIVAFIKDSGVKAVFLEYGKNRKLLDQIANASGAVVGGQLYVDGIPDPATGILGYEAAIRHNVTTIMDALR